MRYSSYDMQMQRKKLVKKLEFWPIFLLIFNVSFQSTFLIIFEAKEGRENAWVMWAWVLRLEFEKFACGAGDGKLKHKYPSSSLCEVLIVPAICLIYSVN